MARIRVHPRSERATGKPSASATLERLRRVFGPIPLSSELVARLEAEIEQENEQERS